jgi:two-component system, LytTR family, sensor kinase
MKRNLIFNKLFMRSYLVFATVVSLSFFLVFYYYFNLPWLQAIVDATLSVFSLCTMLLSFYFVVRFARTDTLTSFTSIRNSTIAGILLVTVWFFFAQYTLDFLFGDDIAYSDFLHQSHLLRLLGGGVITSWVYMSFFLLIYEKTVKEKSERENELMMLLQKTELQALKNQLNPHFIYNSLNSISSLTLYSPEKAREMTSLLSDFLRIALRQDAMQMSELADELKNVDLYLKIEKVRFEEKLNWHFKVDEAHLNYRVPAMILQPLLENAVKHGVQQSPQPSAIELSTQLIKNALHITISNPFDPDFQRFKGEGVGMDNIHNRLRLIYGRTGLLKTEVTQNNFIVNLQIPL